MTSLFVQARRSIRREVERNTPDGIIALWGLPSGVFARWAAEHAGCGYATWLLGSDVWRASSLPMGRRALTNVLKDSSGRFADGLDLAAEATRLTGQSVEFLPSVRTLPPAADAYEPTDFFFVGRFHSNKGPDLLVEALHELQKRGRAFTARIFGAGPLETSIKSRVQATFGPDQVAVGGPIDSVELAGRLRSTRSLVIPSRVESIPLILGDAVQANTPVVAARVGDMGRVVDDLGLGTTVAPGDPEELADALEAILDTNDPVEDWSAAEQLFDPLAATTTLVSAALTGSNSQNQVDQTS